MDEEDDSSSLSSFISIGTAEVQPLPAVKPHENEPNALPEPPTTANHTLAELIDMHRIPPMPSLQSSRHSLDTMHHLKETGEETKNRRSIIDPSTVKVSFIGTLSQIPMGLPLEEGLQRLYKLYQENDPAPSPLPREVPITDVPLTTIAESLESHILEMKAALADCASNIENLNLTNDQTKKDLMNLEFQYCIARQEANMCHMSADDFRLRLEWQKEEIARVNAEKEVAIAANLAYVREQTRLREELNGLVGLRRENENLKRVNNCWEGRVRELQGELEEARMGLDRARFALKSVPGPMRKLCVRMLVPIGEVGGNSQDGMAIKETGTEKEKDVEQEGRRHKENKDPSARIHERRESRPFF